MRTCLRELPWLLAALAPVAILCAPVIAGGIWMLQEIGISDLLYFNAALRAELLGALAQGRLPVWSSRVYTGWPLVAETQIGAFCPAFWIGPASDPVRATCLSVVLLLALAALSTYYLARTLGLSRAGAAVAGGTWPLAGMLVNHIEHPNLHGGIALAPLAFAFVEQSLRPGRAHRLLWLAPVMAFAFFGGHPQMVHVVSVALALQLALRAVWPAPGGERPGAGHLKWLLAAVAVTLLLTAPQLVPALELARQTDRGAGLPAADAAVGSMEPAWLARWIYPWVHGDVSRLGTAFPADGVFLWTHAGWLALAGLGMACWGAVRGGARGGSRAQARFAVAAVAVTLVIAFGRHTPLFPLVLAIPGYRLFRFPSRILFVTELVLALLAGRAVDEAARRSAAPEADASARRRPRIARLALAGAVALHFTLLLAIDLPALPTMPAGAFPPPSDTARYLRERPGSRYATLFYREAWIEAYVRAQGWRGDLTPYLYVHETLRPNANLFHGLASSHGYSTLQLSGMQLEDALFALDRPDGNHPPTRVPDPLMQLLDRAATTHLVSVRPLTNSNLREVLCTKLPWAGFQVRIYEIAGARPRVRLEPAGAGTARIDAEGPSALAVEVDAARDAMLVVADTAYPGWHAEVDGRPVPMTRADGCYRALPVPAGRHSVRMVFLPTGQLATVLAMALGVLALAWFGRLGGRGGGAPPVIDCPPA